MKMKKDESWNEAREEEEEGKVSSLPLAPPLSLQPK